MARIRLKHVNSFPNPNCRDPTELRYYFRRGGKNIRLPGQPGSEEFMAAYAAALAATSNAPDNGAGRTIPGTIGALRAAYFSSGAWQNLPPDTRKNRRPIIDRFCDRNHDRRVALLQPRHIEKAINELTAGPATKDYWLRAIRAFLQSGIPNVIKENPTAGIKVNRPKTEGHHTWTEEEIAQYRAYWPLGTEARLVFEFALETVSRRGEVVRLGPQHIYRGKDGEPRIKIARLKSSRDVDMPMTDDLLAAVLAMKVDHLTYITSERGQPISKITLGHRFAKWATEAGLPKRCRMHGLKKSGCCERVLAGATAPEFMADTGHKDMRVAQAYIEKVFKRPELSDASYLKLRTKRGGGLTKTSQHTYKTG
jgi:integrase